MNLTFTYVVFNFFNLMQCEILTHTCVPAKSLVEIKFDNVIQFT